MSEQSVTPWYALEGPDNDIVFSTKVRFARNLVNFDFLEKISTENSARIRSLFKDAFVKFDKEECFHPVNISNLDYTSLKLIMERGLFKEKALILDEAEIFMTSDGSTIPTVNIDDHYRIVSFSAGFNISEAYSKAVKVDSELQDYLQVAFSLDFGYLNSSVKDCGSGMKISVFLHLPAMAENDKMEELKIKLKNRGVLLKKYLPHFYFLQTTNSYDGSEVSQIQNFSAIVSEICTLERNARIHFYETKTSIVKDMLFKGIAVFKYGIFLNFEEGMRIISVLKLGKDLEIIKGIEDSDFLSLYYRIQGAHLGFVSDFSNINFEKDIDTKSLKINRLRALLFQEAFSKIEICG
ncbi:MAG: hypothetical protein ACTTHG_06940 [Treponemataceae bacterium]